MLNLNVKMERELVNVTMETVKALAESVKVELNESNLSICKKAVAVALSDYRDILKMDEAEQWNYMTFGYLYQTVHEAYCDELTSELLAADGQ